MRSTVSFLIFLCAVVTVRNNEAKNKVIQEESSSDIVSVSKFISDFHRQFEDESLSMVRPEFISSKGQRFEMNEVIDSDPPESISNSETTPNISAEKNVTFHIKCNEGRKHGSLTVEVVNSTRLGTILTSDPVVTSRHTPGDCVVVLFYSRTCPFSCLAAPHFNALPRAFPTIKMAAINAIQHQSFNYLLYSFNTQFGIAGVPTVMLFHNGRPAAKFNDSEYTLEMFARFITRFTGVKGVDKMYVTSSDFGGPVPSSLAKEPDLLLAMAWAVVVAAVAVAVSRSPGWRSIVEAVANTWREAQAHHDHNY